MCTHEITAHFTVKDMAQRLTPKSSASSILATPSVAAIVKYSIANSEKSSSRCDVRKNPTCWGEDYDKENQVKRSARTEMQKM